MKSDPEFIDALRALLGLDPIPNAKVRRNTELSTDNELERFNPGYLHDGNRRMPSVHPER